MARIDWVKQKLNNWGRWCQQKDSGGLGYPSQCVFARLGGSGGGREANVPISSLDAAETDQGVQALRWMHPHLYLTLTLIYARGFPRYQVAKKMARAESTIDANLASADHALARWFDDRQALRADAKQRYSVNQ
jgi:hypothetical protein